MKKLITILVTWLTTTVAIAVPGPSTPDLPLSNLTHGLHVISDLPIGVTEPVTAADGDAGWDKSVARGVKLLQGMKASDVEAAALFGLGTTAESPFDGNGKKAFETWGYLDNDKLNLAVDKECDFEGYHKIKKTMEELGMGTKSKGNNGPNQCFTVQHWDGPAIKKFLGIMPKPQNQKYKVCKKEYRATEATHTMGVNAAGGAIFMMNSVSAAHGAARLWGKKPNAEDLPHIRSVSDIAWSFWNRAAAAGNIQNINYLFVNLVMNDETNHLIELAHRGLSPPKSAPSGWPGTEFLMDSQGGQAILGSPVGRWAGYFLMQHKRQLGGNKYISKVRVFKSESFGPYLYMLFYVAGPGATGSGHADPAVLAKLEARLRL